MCNDEFYLVFTSCWSRCWVSEGCFCVSLRLWYAKVECLKYLTIFLHVTSNSLTLACNNIPSLTISCNVCPKQPKEGRSTSFIAFIIFAASSRITKCSLLSLISQACSILYTLAKYSPVWDPSNGWTCKLADCLSNFFISQWAVRLKQEAVAPSLLQASVVKLNEACLWNSVLYSRSNASIYLR